MENKEFEQLMVGGADGALTEEQRSFVATHRRILACGNMAGQYLVEMAQNLKKMRDGKLYRAAGFAEFRDYVREAIGIEERQAYNYIRVAEGLPQDFLAEHAGLGITKLSILAAAEPEDRAAAIESGAADASVRALQEKIRALEAERDSRAEQLSLFESRVREAERARAEIEIDRRTANDGWEKAKADAEAAKSDAEKARGLLKLAEAKVTRLTEEKARAEKEAKDLKSAPPRIEQVDNPETEAKLAAAEADRDAAVAALETAKKQLEIAADDKMTRFSVLFEEFQVTLGKMLALAGEMEESRHIKCIAALQSIIRGRGL